MAAIDQQRRLTGPENLALTLLFMAPAVISLFASYALAHAWEFSTSALWFVYEVSFFLGICGACVAGTLTIVQLSRRHIPAPFVCLMGVVTLGAIAIVWYAAHIYRNPWKW
jgi:cytochrome c biogenesis protein CcdA